MSRHPLFSSVCFVILLNVTAAFAEDPARSRPVNVAVSPDGNTVLATSMGSTSMTEAKWNGSTYVLSDPIAVGYSGWGLVFIDPNQVAVTHPTATVLSILTRPGPGGSFAKTDEIDLGSQFRYSTELIGFPGTSSVLVANRGMPLSGQPSWTNALYQVDVTTRQITATVLTEREPRALAVSPGAGCRLFVGHVQGSLGGPPLATNHPDPDADNYQNGAFLGDGGSILVYNACSWNLEGPQLPMNGERIGVGSPVRGIAVSGNADGSYVVYFTSVGDNANSEDPEEVLGQNKFFGGRQIPNVITALYYSASDVLQDVERGVFDHQPDWRPTDLVPDGTTFSGMMGLPAVLPDKIVVRDVTIQGQRARELFVTNSGSGTLSRTPLDADGSLRFSADPSFFLTRARLTRVPSDIREIDITEEQNVEYKKLLVVTDASETVNVSHVDLSRGNPPFTSNTRAVAYDPTKDVIWVATQFDNELIKVTAEEDATFISQRLPIASKVAGDAERNFFGFGRGFFFREVPLPPLPPPVHTHVSKVGTQTCATCHVDAHTDGKVRITKRGGQNNPTASRQKPVAVPSCFDVLATEWLFFEGLKTIRDGQFRERLDCDYCNQTSFFDDTEEFTNGLTSPRSPHNWQGTLSANTLRGRHLFEAMNCSRCHMGVPQPFTRTVELALEEPQGPLFTSTNRMLNDPTQVFLTFNENLSRRNMTDVGTRPANDGVANGINTPALAGAWDNRPYMHDGRYRTLDEVLDNTWLQDAPAFQAAPVVLHPEVPDNALNGDIGVIAPVTTLHEFKTHQHGSPGSGWTSVSTKLSASDYADLKAFLLSLSSQTDPCIAPPNFVLNLSVKNGVVKCASPVKIQCRFDWDGPVAWSDTTAWGTLHASQLPGGAEEGTYLVTVTPLVRPVCGEPDIEEILVEMGPSYTYSRDVPKVTEMAASRPNPFNPTTTIGFSLAQDDHVSVVVFDAAGRVVRTLVDEHRKADQYAIVWDGSDNRGAPVASGVYFCRMIAGSYQLTQKLVLLK